MRLKKSAKIVIIVVTILLILFLVLFGCFKFFMAPIDSKDKNSMDVIIDSGTSASGIAEILKEKGLIKNVSFFKLYVKFHKIEGFKAGKYELSKKLNLKEIIDILVDGNNYNESNIKLTFKEGKRLVDYVDLIANNTVHSKEEILDVFKDQNFLNKLVKKYWFIDDDILNKDLYYPLEGYLFPDTYYFSSKNVAVEDIVETLLDEMGKNLEKYKKEINNGPYSVHEILTLASIIENEGKLMDFYDISSVFHNRLDRKWKLESCATAYYGAQEKFDDVGIATSDMINNNNLYNTYKVLELPVGPISMPSEKAIDAAISPKKTDNLYFISDNEGNSYFFVSIMERNKKKQELELAGKWKR